MITDLKAFFSHSLWKFVGFIFSPCWEFPLMNFDRACHMVHRFYHPAESTCVGVSRRQLTNIRKTLQPSSWKTFRMVIYSKKCCAAPKIMAMTPVKLLFCELLLSFCSRRWTCRRCNFRCSKQVFFPGLPSFVVSVMVSAEIKNLEVLSCISNYILIKGYMQCLFCIVFTCTCLDLKWFNWAQGCWF